MHIHVYVYVFIYRYMYMYIAHPLLYLKSKVYAFYLYKMYTKGE